MNGINNTAGQRVGEPTVPAVGKASPDAGKSADNPQALTSKIAENRSKINAGWEELSRLDQALASLEARSRRTPVVSAVKARTPDSAAIITKAA